jgi:phage repressor protein C with HTH and peptisase S24 domain
MASMSFGESFAVAVQYPRMTDDPELGRRIRFLRTNILEMKSQQEFADRLGEVTRGAVGNWERGKGIKRANLELISKTFSASFEWLATGRGEPLDGELTTSITKSSKVGLAPVKGFVEAGHWQDVFYGGADDMHEYVPTSSDYPADWQYAYIVHGESINRTARDGDKLICVDLVKSHVAIRDGDLVIVERSRFDGQIVERTAKRVKQTLRGIELWPDSEHPDHQTPIPYETDDETAGVLVTAKVVWVLRKP